MTRGNTYLSDAFVEMIAMNPDRHTNTIVEHYVLDTTMLDVRETQVGIRCMVEGFTWT